MKKITKLEDLKKLNKSELVEEMLQGTIKGGSSCGNINPTPRPRPIGQTLLPNGSIDWQ